METNTAIWVLQAPSSPQMLVTSLEFPQVPQETNASANKHKVTNIFYVFIYQMYSRSKNIKE